MKDKIAIIASGGDVLAAKTVLNRLGYSDFIIMTAEQAKQELPFPKSEPIPYVLNPPMPPMFQEKQFVCKGIHQYREIQGKWVCQCGRVL